MPQAKPGRSVVQGQNSTNLCLTFEPSLVHSTVSIKYRLLRNCNFKLAYLHFSGRRPRGGHQRGRSAAPAAARGGAIVERRRRRRERERPRHWRPQQPLEAQPHGRHTLPRVRVRVRHVRIRQYSKCGFLDEIFCLSKLP